VTALFRIGDRLAARFPPAACRGRGVGPGPVGRDLEVFERLDAADDLFGGDVGLRPGRPSVRLEVEQVGDARCAHNYGHGGSGVTLSWGCAREATALLTDQESG